MAARWRWLTQLGVGIGLCALASLVHGRLGAAEPLVSGKLLGTVQSPVPVVSYTLEARLDPKTHHVHGSGRVRWKNTSRVAQRSLFLHLYLNAFADEETVFMRKPMPGFRGARYPSTWGGIDIKKLYAPAFGVDLWALADKYTPGDPKDATDIEIPLPEPVAPGGVLELDLEWVSRLPSVTHRTGFAGSFHMVAQWFPKIARLERDGTWAHFPFHRLSEFYADFGKYDVTITTPAAFLVGATGEESERLEDGETTRVRYVAERVHDFAFAAWDGFAERTTEGPGGVSLRCLYPRGLDTVADSELAEVKAALPALGEAYGPYPYPTLTIVHPPRWAADAGGMEYPTLITTGGHWLAPALGAKTIPAVTVHELAHQWFYGMLASNEFRYPFLDEGLTTFASTHALEARYPARSAFEGFGWDVSLWAVSRAQAARAWDAGVVARGADAFGDGSDYGRLVYGKTATLLETLRRVYGDGPFFAALRDYADSHRFSHPTPADLLSAVDEHMGPAAAANLRLGLLEGGWVDYRAADLDGESDVFAVRQGELAFDVDVALHHADGSTRRVAWPASERTFSHAADGVVAVAIDPDHAVLIDHDLTNNQRRRGQSAVAPRVLTQLGFVTQLLTTVLAP